MGAVEEDKEICTAEAVLKKKSKRRLNEWLLQQAKQPWSQTSENRPNYLLL